MPLLEHLGVTVVDERPVRDRHAATDRRWIYSFGVRVDDDRDPLADPGVQARVAELFLGVWAGDVENDGLNRLVLRAGLGAARRRDRPRAVPVPPAGRRAVHRRVPRRHAGRRTPTRCGSSSRCSTNASIPTAPATIAAEAALDAELGRRRRRRRQPRRRPHPARAVAGRAARRCAPTRTSASRTWREVRPDRARLPAPSDARSTRSGWRRRGSRACTCAPATSPAAASAGPTAARTSAPRSSGS